MVWRKFLMERYRPNWYHFRCRRRTDIRQALVPGVLAVRNRTTIIHSSLAGLMLLVSLGVSSCADGLGMGGNAALRDEVVKAWRTVDETWDLASEYACGRCGPWPFDKAHKDALLKRLGRFDRQVEALVELKELRRPEAGALRLEFEFLLEQIQLMTAFDLRKGWPRDYKLDPKELKRTEQWLADLDAISKVDRPHRQIIDYVIDEAEMKAHNLAWWHILEDSYETHQRRETLATKLRAYGRKLRNIPTRVSPVLTEDKDWRTLVGVLANDDRDPYESSGARERTKLTYDQAIAIIEKLGERKVLRSPEIKAMRRVLGSFSDGDISPFEGDPEGLFDLESSGGGAAGAETETCVNHVGLWYRGVIKMLGELGAQKSIPRGFGKIVRDTIEQDMCRYHGLSSLSSWRWRLFTNCSSTESVSVHPNTEGDKKVRAAIGKIDSLPAGDMTKLSSSEHWKRIVAAQRQASSLASRIWRVSRLERRRVKESFESLDKSISALVDQRLVTKAEAAILQVQRRAFITVLDYGGGYSFFRDEGFLWEFDACSRLARRAGYIEKLTSLRRPDWRVVRRVLVMARADIYRVEQAMDESGSHGSGPQIKEVPRQVKRIGDAARIGVAGLEARLPVSGNDLARTCRWQQITNAWRDLQAFSTWDDEHRVLNGMGNMRMLGRVRNAIRNIEKLRTARRLSEPEAEMLKEDFKVFLYVVRYHYSWGIGMIVSDGYRPAFPAYEDNWDTLAKRLGLLEKICDSDRIRLDVVGKLLYMAEAEAKAPLKRRFGNKGTEEQIRRGRYLKRQMIEIIARLRERLKRPASPLKTNRQWMEIVNLCSTAATRITQGVSTMQRRELRIRLAHAGTEAYRLYAIGALNSYELEIATWEMTHLRQALTFLPPTDFGKGFYVSRAEGPFSDDIVDFHHFRKSQPMNKLTDPSLAKILRAALEMDLKLMERSNVPPRLKKWKHEAFHDAVKSIKDMLAKIKSRTN